MEHLFVYGTLLNPHIERLELGKVFEGRPDMLPGYTCVDITIDGNGYPCAVPMEGESIKGSVYHVAPGDLAHADTYEGTGYRRIKVTLASGTEAWMYTKNI